VYNKLPEDVKGRNKPPELLYGLQIYFDAFSDLQSERSVGMALGPIPWYSIVKWCELHGIYDPDNIDTFSRYLRAMEKVQMEHNKDGE